MTKAIKTKKTSGRMCIVGNGPWGLWYGEVRASDAEVAKTHSVRIYHARGIRRWYCRLGGGITSLAALGPSGPRVDECRIGAEIASTLLLDVKALHECSPEAVAAFASVKPNA